MEPQTIVLQGFTTNENPKYQYNFDNETKFRTLKEFLSQHLTHPVDNIVLYYRRKNERNRSEISDDELLSNVVHSKNIPILYSFVQKSNKQGHGDTHYTCIQNSIVPHPGIRNLAELFKFQVDEFRHKNLFGEQIHIDNSSHYQWLTYEEFYNKARNVCSGLIHRGINSGARIGIMGHNRLEWVLADFACRLAGYVSVPMYDTAGINTISYVINHSDSEIVFCSTAQQVLVQSILHKCPCVKLIVWFETASQMEETEQMITIEKLETIGRTNPATIVNNQDIDDIFSILYTSGTTGEPKGVPLSHKNFIYGVHGYATRAIPVDHNITHLSYLPLGHIYERINIGVSMQYGGCIGFYCGDKTKIIEDAKLLQPTFFPAVPRVWDMVYSSIVTLLNGKSNEDIEIFKSQMQQRISRFNNGEPIVDLCCQSSPIFKEIELIVGGNLKLGISAAASLPPSKAEFLRCALNILFLEGYGLTESTGTVCCMNQLDISDCTIGIPYMFTEVKLVNVEDMNFYVNDKPNPRGEIWIKSPTLFKGYYKRDDLTQEAFEQGWFKTGDVGMWLPDGNLKIIDRKKNIYKLSQGVYVRPEFIENVMRQSPYISNICVYGDAYQRYLVAIICPSQILWTQCDNNAEVAKAFLMNEIYQLSKQNELQRFEYIKDLHISFQDFTVDNGLLTPSLKLRRHVVVKTYKNEIQTMYEHIDCNTSTNLH